MRKTLAQRPNRSRAKPLKPIPVTPASAHAQQRVGNFRVEGDAAGRCSGQIGHTSRPSTSSRMARIWRGEFWIRVACTRFAGQYHPNSPQVWRFPIMCGLKGVPRNRKMMPDGCFVSAGRFAGTCRRRSLARSEIGGAVCFVSHEERARTLALAALSRPTPVRNVTVTLVRSTKDPITFKIRWCMCRLIPARRQRRLADRHRRRSPSCYL